jgi:hypothetical protein
LYKNPILRDTVTLYAYEHFNTLGLEGTPCGWRLIRLKANNPGFWNIHCHITPHMIAGMQTVMIVAPEKIPSLPKNLNVHFDTLNTNKILKKYPFFVLIFLLCIFLKYNFLI